MVERFVHQLAQASENLTENDLKTILTVNKVNEQIKPQWRSVFCNGFYFLVHFENEPGIEAKMLASISVQKLK